MQITKVNSVNTHLDDYVYLVQAQQEGQHQQLNSVADSSKMKNKNHN